MDVRQHDEEEDVNERKPFVIFGTASSSIGNNESDPNEPTTTTGADFAIANRKQGVEITTQRKPQTTNDFFSSFTTTVLKPVPRSTTTTEKSAQPRSLDNQDEDENPLGHHNNIPINTKNIFETSTDDFQGGNFGSDNNDADDNNISYESTVNVLSNNNEDDNSNNDIEDNLSRSSHNSNVISSSSSNNHDNSNQQSFTTTNSGNNNDNRNEQSVTMTISSNNNNYNSNKNSDTTTKSINNNYNSNENNDNVKSSSNNNNRNQFQGNQIFSFNVTVLNQATTTTTRATTTTSKPGPSSAKPRKLESDGRRPNENNFFYRTTSTVNKDERNRIYDGENLISSSSAKTEKTTADGDGLTIVYGTTLPQQHEHREEKKTTGYYGGKTTAYYRPSSDMTLDFSLESLQTTTEPMKYAQETTTTTTRRPNNIYFVPTLPPSRGQNRITTTTTTTTAPTLIITTTTRPSTTRKNDRFKAGFVSSSPTSSSSVTESGRSFASNGINKNGFNLVGTLPAAKPTVNADKGSSTEKNFITQPYSQIETYFTNDDTFTLTTAGPTTTSTE